MDSPEDAATSPDECFPGSPTPLMPEGEADELVRLLRAIADPTRVRLLRYLAHSSTGMTCACHLPEALGLSQPTLSFHLRKLHGAGLIDREKRGRWAHWTVRYDALERVSAFLEMRPQGEPAY